MWFVTEYTAPDALPDLSHTVVTLPFIEIDGLCVVSPLAKGTTQVLSVIVSVAPSASVWQGQHSEAFLKDRSEPLGASLHEACHFSQADVAFGKHHGIDRFHLDSEIPSAT